MGGGGSRHTTHTVYVQPSLDEKRKAVRDNISTQQAHLDQTSTRIAAEILESEQFAQRLIESQKAWLDLETASIERQEALIKETLDAQLALYDKLIEEQKESLREQEAALEELDKTYIQVTSDLNEAKKRKQVNDEKCRVERQELDEEIKTAKNNKENALNQLKQVRDGHGMANDAMAINLFEELMGFQMIDINQGNITGALTNFLKSIVTHMTERCEVVIKLTHQYGWVESAEDFKAWFKEDFEEEPVRGTKGLNFLTMNAPYEIQTDEEIQEEIQESFKPPIQRVRHFKRKLQTGLKTRKSQEAVIEEELDELLRSLSFLGHPSIQEIDKRMNNLTQPPSLLAIEGPA